MAKAAVTEHRYCECLSIAGGLRGCPAHGEFATASARRHYEGEIDRLREALKDAVVAARLFNRSGMTWLEYDAELVRLSRIADDG